MLFYSNNYEETISIGEKIANSLKPGDIVALNGGLGVGKTVISKGIAKGLGVKEEVTSPTYNIICEYNSTIPFYHMDLYRIDSYEEFEMLGAEPLLFGEGVSIIEWSERIIDYLPNSIISINISIDIDHSTRIINVKGLDL